MAMRLTKEEAVEMLEKIGERGAGGAMQSAVPRHARAYREIGATVPCPECGKPARIKPRSILFCVGVILFFPFGLLFLLEPRVCECAECGIRFKHSGLKLW